MTSPYDNQVAAETFEKAPRRNFIDDLVLGKSGIDATLQWTEVTDDVFGKPTLSIQPLLQFSHTPEVCG